MSPPVHSVALFGPTGVGKTAVAIELARLLRARGERPVAISADALQVYRGLEILTGVADAAQRAELEHRLVSFLPIDASFSAGEYAQLAHAEIDATLAEGRRPIVVGGTGLYLRAALADLDFEPAPPDGPSQLWSDEMRRPTLLVGLVIEREALYRQIDVRVDEMLRAGVLEEVRAAHAAGAGRATRKALGFEELLAGDIDAMKRRTRNYARRQLTWMRKLAPPLLIDLGECTPEQAGAQICAALTDDALKRG
ncbi:MAG TPA: isopentenyl transferase family protein [Solirubrobacteraceae bacterium]|jgi:tRNA dimethylallyltransferase|nr:isopentenyl transferase family protein [Solirubrobacteraceae bacterium]